VPDSLLSQGQLAELERQWKRYGLTLPKGLELRRRARTDLFYLSNKLLGKTLAPCHQEVCDFFVHKDPDATDFLKFAESYDYPHVDSWGRMCRGSRESLLWLMRSGLKSAIDICDKVQWIICFPDIRIRILTDVLGLAQQFVGSVVGYFRLQTNGDPQEIQGKPSLFQILFPEFCEVHGRDEFAANEIPKWTTPARKNRLLLAPTIIAGSLEAGKTGSHCDVLVFDDAITPENMGKTEKSIATNLKGINRRISMTLRLLDHPGFAEFIGTPQHPLDYLSQKVTAENERMVKRLPPQCRVLIRPAYVPVPGKEGLPPDKLTRDDVVEWWPERMPFEEVRRLWDEPEGHDTVATQLLLDVSLKQSVKFTRQALLAATVPWNRIPRQGKRVMSIDLAYSTKPRADFTCMGTAQIEEARFYLTGLKRGKFGPRVMANEIAMEIFKQRPDSVIIEDSVGAQWLHNDVDRELAKLGYDGAAIEWVGLGQGKFQKIVLDADLLVRLLGELRLLLSTEIEKLEDVYEELEAFPSPKHHDDVVAMLNQMCRRFLTEADLSIARSSEAARRMEDSLWEQGIHGYAAETKTNEALGTLISMELPE
jgi:phage terminase large subunit-like protein